VERSQPSEGFEEQKEEAENGFSPSTRAAPSSLTMLDSLFFLYELNPVNPKAQGMVTVPEGLDLDATINPLWGTDKDGLDISDAEEVDDFGRPLRKVVREEEVTIKKKKGKGSTKKGSSKRRGYEEDPEELERVSSLLPSRFSPWLTSSFFFFSNDSIEWNDNERIPTTLAVPQLLRIKKRRRKKMSIRFLSSSSISTYLLDGNLLLLHENQRHRRCSSMSMERCQPLSPRLHLG